MKQSIWREPDAIDRLRTAWSNLQPPTPFQTPEWAGLWLEVFGGGTPAIWTLHEGDDLVGLFPMVERRLPWRTLRSLGVGPSDVLDPLAAPGYEGVVRQELAGALSEWKGVDVLDLHQLRTPIDSAGAQRFEQALSLILDLSSSFEAYLLSLGKSLRYDARFLERASSGSRNLSIEIASAETAEAAIELLFDLHRARWRRKGLPGAFLGRARDFHRQWARIAAEKGWLRLSVLKEAGTPVGALYGMRMMQTDFYYQAGWAPARRPYSPGTLLVAHAIRSAIEDGSQTFDFLRGDEPYKRRWKPQREVHHARLIAARSGWGALGSAWNRMGETVEHRIRRRLEGGGLPAHS